jgi:aldehyde dehydrogenase (NAD+)
MIDAAVCLTPFDAEGEAIEIANNTPYGLSGAIHTTDLDHGAELAKLVDTGMCHVNGPTIADEVIVPFGGRKDSGGHYLGGDWTLNAFTRPKWISVYRGRRVFPF